MTAEKKTLLESRVILPLLLVLILLPFLWPDFLNHLFATYYMPHGHCYLWEPGLVGLHVISDGLIGLSYLSISLTLGYLVNRAPRTLPYNWMFLAFGGFIVACGGTHFMEILTLWESAYWASGYVKFVTAVVSLTTAIALPPLVPRIFLLMRNAEMSAARKQELERLNQSLESEIIERKRIEAELKISQEQLERRVAERTAELSEANRLLQQEIQERRQAEAGLYESEQRFRQLAESMDEVFWMTDARTRRVLYVSPGFEKVCGRSWAEVGDSDETRLNVVVHPDDRTVLLARFDAWYAADCAWNLDCEFRIVTSAGAVRWINLRGFPVRNQAGVLYRASGIAQDVTERKLMIEEQAKTSKLESIGILAGGIAHDFNNVLMIVWGNISLARRNLSNVAKAEGKLIVAEQGIDRARHIASRLLTFARGGDPVREVVRLENFLPESVKFGLSGSKVVEQMGDLRHLWNVEIDLGQIDQVLQNLTLNARDAMPDGGHFRVTGENVVVTDQSGLPLEAGRYVKLRFVDSGIGIPSENLSRIFDPYFSTKQFGQGLGLAVSYSIVKRHQGYLTAVPSAGEGAIFEMYLPAVEADVSTPAVTAAESPAVAAPARILIMDDEEGIREFVQEVLEDRGFEVASAANGSDAVRLFTEAHSAGRPFTVVMLDLTVPGDMGGRDALARMLDIDQAVCAVMCSGYSDSPVMTDHERHGFRAALTKPFSIEALIAVIHRLVDESK